MPVLSTLQWHHDVHLKNGKVPETNKGMHHMTHPEY